MLMDAVFQEMNPPTIQLLEAAPETVTAGEVPVPLLVFTLAPTDAPEYSSAQIA